MRAKKTAGTLKGVLRVKAQVKGFSWMRADTHRRFSQLIGFFTDEWALTGSNRRPTD